MNVVMTGNGKSGSWRIRGEQLGSEIGATLAPRSVDFAMADLVVYVKRVTEQALNALRRVGVPWVWDVVDAWPQPAGNAWNKADALAWLRRELARLKPSAVVFPTKAMLDDSDWDGPALALKHHAWPKYRANPVRQAVKAIGYEGGESYLGAWRDVLAAECDRRGWAFKVNAGMADIDIGVALRSSDGHPARHWKSNCKLANLQALGVPAICSPESGYLECKGGNEIFVDTRQQLERAFDFLTDYHNRCLLAERARASTPTLSTVALEYSTWLQALKF